MPNSGQMFSYPFSIYRLQIGTRRIWVQTISFKSEKNKQQNRKEVEPCLQYISSLKLPQREALMNIGPINAPIWSNLNMLNTENKWPLHVELSMAIISWSTGHLKLSQQKALTKYNRQVSAIVRVPMVTVLAGENLVHLWVQTISFKSEKKQAIEKKWNLACSTFPH